MASSNAWALGAALACGLNAACATGTTTHKSYILPAVQIVAMDSAVNLAGRHLTNPANYEVTPASIRRNLRGPWVVDDDPFEINQFLHPYQGAMYHGIARSNGLSYWPSVAYTFAGSALWEIAGENTPPSRNDQIASGIAGSFLGEPLFRISRLLLERADHGPGAWRTLASVLASPPAGINHVLVGNPEGSLAPDAVPFSDIRVQFGASATATGRSRLISSRALHRPRLALSMDYGYPGNAGYRHQRPFDYFRIDSSVSADGMEQLSTRGLIAGADYGAGRLGGIWGLYGSYDYFAPEDFHFSSTAVSFGTTLQASISESLIVQSSGLVGGGYAAAQSPTSTLSSQAASADTTRPVGRARLPLRCRAAGARKLAIHRRAPGSAGFDRAGVLHQRRWWIRHCPARFDFRGRYLARDPYPSAARAGPHLSTRPPPLGPSREAGSHAGAVDRRHLLHVPRFRRLRRGAVGVLSSHRKDAGTQGPRYESEERIINASRCSAAASSPKNRS